MGHNQSKLLHDYDDNDNDYIISLSIFTFKSPTWQDKQLSWVYSTNKKHSIKHLYNTALSSPILTHDGHFLTWWINMRIANTCMKTYMGWEYIIQLMNEKRLGCSFETSLRQRDRDFKRVKGSTQILKMILEDRFYEAWEMYETHPLDWMSSFDTILVSYFTSEVQSMTIESMMLHRKRIGEVQPCATAIKKYWCRYGEQCSTCRSLWQMQHSPKCRFTYPPWYWNWRPQVAFLRQCNQR